MADLAVRLGPIELPNPIVAASGTFGHGTEVAALCPPAGIGAVTVKSLSPFPWPGNPPPRLHPAPSGMLNAVGLQNPGVAHWLEHALPPLRAAGARVIASIWGHHVDDFAEAARLLTPAASELLAIEVNASCPNLDDRSQVFAHSTVATGAITRAVVDAARGLPVFVKLSPNHTDVREIAAAALDAGATGLTLVNTVMGMGIDAATRRPVLGNTYGGLSGPAIKPIALRAVHEVASAHPGVPIIGTGGVTTGTDAVEMLLAGASAVGVGTATFHEPRATLRIVDELAGWCARHGVTRVAELRGAVVAR